MWICLVADAQNHLNGTCFCVDISSVIGCPWTAKLWLPRPFTSASLLPRNMAAWFQNNRIFTSRLQRCQLSQYCREASAFMSNIVHPFVVKGNIFVTSTEGNFCYLMQVPHFCLMPALWFPQESYFFSVVGPNCCSCSTVFGVLTVFKISEVATVWFFQSKKRECKLDVMLKFSYNN